MALFNIYYVLRQLDLTYKYCARFNLYLVVVVVVASYCRSCRCRSYSFLSFVPTSSSFYFISFFFAFLVVVLTNIIVVVICLSAVFFFFLHNKFLDVFCVCPRFFLSLLPYCCRILPTWFRCAFSYYFFHLHLYLSCDFLY